MSKTVITVNHLSKQYKLDTGNQTDTLRDFISELPKRIFDLHLRKKDIEKFWALKDVSFKVNKGEVLGIIGRNGAGKSTLLKVLARIVAPTKGSASITGRVASILEVGTGFHTELTGRENIFLNGAILGMKHAEIKRKFNDIVEFSGIGKFLDMPVKRYSSGMQVRLAFSVAAHLDPEILLIDEVLAVGDMAFQRKSLMKMQSIAKDEGRTVVYVSHNMASIDSLCSSALLLEEGRVAARGKARKVISEYITDYVPVDDTPNIAKKKVRSGSGKVKIMDFWIEDARHKRTKLIASGDKCYFVFKYICPSGRPQKDVDLGFAVSSLMDQPLFLHYMSFTNQQLNVCPPQGKFVFGFNKFPLAEGQYKIGIRATVQGKEADHIPGATQFEVEDGDFYKIGLPVAQKHSPIYIEGGWKIKK